jgi:hypothetical protein
MPLTVPPSIGRGLEEPIWPSAFRTFALSLFSYAAASERLNKIPHPARRRFRGYTSTDAFAAGAKMVKRTARHKID